jgi:hypothetical protein
MATRQHIFLWVNTAFVASPLDEYDRASIICPAMVPDELRWYSTSCIKQPVWMTLFFTPQQVISVHLGSFCS